MIRARALLPERLKTILRPLYRRITGIPEKPTPDPRWIQVHRRLAQSGKIIDLGCGNNPVKGATVGVDLYQEPTERIWGVGPMIDAEALQQRGVTFINSRIDAGLPFEDKEFDFAYSHHAFEHLEDPLTPCHEMTRIAKSGAIITPSVLAELIFGRPYHRWLVMDRANTLLFFRKRPFEDRPFGEHPHWDQARQRWIVEEQTNPFEILLDDGHWYRGRERLPRLTNILKAHWCSHSPLIEVVFLWEDGFEAEVYD